MVWRPKWLGGGGKDASGPILDTPEVTAKRVAQKRKADLAEWIKIKASGPLPDKITRGDLEATLTKQGFKKRRAHQESFFTKRLDDRCLVIFISLKTISEGEGFAPHQQVLVTGSMSTHAYAAVEAEIMGQDPTHVVMAGLGQRRIRDFILTQERVAANLMQIETELKAIDATKVLAQFRQFESSSPGSAGLRLLSALALAGDVDRLDSYVRRRMDGDTCGFVPFISDEMIKRAAKIGHRYG